MRRRTLWLGGGAAALAVATGAGAHWWRDRQSAAAQGTALWPLRFDRPEGGTLDMASLRGTPLLVNFWATWCPPCVAELPLLDRFGRDRPAWRVVGLAVDQLEPVRRFLAVHPVAFPIGLAGLDGVDLARRLGNAAGGLPFSLVFERDGALHDRHLGAITSQALRRWGDAVV